MLAKKISIHGAIILLALAVFVAGCTPAGPRAFLNGKKYLERGDYANAAAQFKTAATLLATNAQVWNYYGVALQGADQPQAAANAYQRALQLDRDLVEAHFNLGNLWLDQNQPDAAKTEFTAYTLRRNNDPAGWLKLGSTQLRLNETVAAEKSFSAVLALKPADAEAYNGLGLARIQRGKPREAAQFFAAAVQSQPGFGSAILNLATVNQQYLHDNKTALENYRAYLALDPRPANWDEVNGIANQLEQIQIAPQMATQLTYAPVVKTNPPATPPPPAKTVSNPVTTRPAVSPKSTPVKVASYNPPPVSTTPVQVVQVQPAPEIITSPRAAANLVATPMAKTRAANPASEEIPVPDEPEQKTGFWHKLFGSSKKENQADSKYLDSGLTPLPADGSTPAQAIVQQPVAAAKPVENPPAAAAAPKSFPRYHYVSPRKPAAGNHATGSLAAGAFTKAQVFDQEEKWPDAVQWYRQAADADPSWFEAQYNTAVLAHRLRLYNLALPYYENALAVQPDSADTRYNFALALKAAGYVPDAVAELKKVLGINPNETRAHLTLGYIYSQTLHDPASARRHYQKVLELEPENPQASEIRFWLAANPG
jgi:tetratricopeptide (TPR) repeat protein